MATDKRTVGGPLDQEQANALLAKIIEDMEEDPGIFGAGRYAFPGLEMTALGLIGDLIGEGLELLGVEGAGGFGSRTFGIQRKPGPEDLRIKAAQEAEESRRRVREAAEIARAQKEATISVEKERAKEQRKTFQQEAKHAREMFKAQTGHDIDMFNRSSMQKTIETVGVQEFERTMAVLRQQFSQENTILNGFFEHAKQLSRETMHKEELQNRLDLVERQEKAALSAAKQRGVDEKGIETIRGNFGLMRAILMGSAGKGQQLPQFGAFVSPDTVGTIAGVQGLNQVMQQQGEGEVMVNGQPTGQMVSGSSTPQGSAQAQPTEARRIAPNEDLVGAQHNTMLTAGQQRLVEQEPADTPGQQIADEILPKILAVTNQGQATQEVMPTLLEAIREKVKAGELSAEGVDAAIADAKERLLKYRDATRAVVEEDASGLYRGNADMSATTTRALNIIHLDFGQAVQQFDSKEMKESLAFIKRDAEIVDQLSEIATNADVSAEKAESTRAMLSRNIGTPQFQSAVENAIKSYTKDEKTVAQLIDSVADSFVLAQDRVGSGEEMYPAFFRDATQNEGNLKRHLKATAVQEMLGRSGQDPLAQTLRGPIAFSNGQVDVGALRDMPGRRDFSDSHQYSRAKKELQNQMALLSVLDPESVSEELRDPLALIQNNIEKIHGMESPAVGQLFDDVQQGANLFGKPQGVSLLDAAEYHEGLMQNAKHLDRGRHFSRLDQAMNRREQLLQKR